MNDALAAISPAKPLRIACSGVVGSDFGSVASAGFEVLQELLRRGHEIDFFSKSTYVYPKQLVEHPGFTYTDCQQPRLDAAIARLRSDHLHWLGLQFGNNAYMRRIVNTMARHHKRREYDSELFLGQWAYGRVPHLPVVSWVQGPPGTDARSIARHGAAIRQLCGWTEFAKLRGFAWYRSTHVGKPPFQHTDISICGSAFAKQSLVTWCDLSPPAVRVLPYPVDLKAFTPSPAPRDSPRGEMLWVGRIVPRKRLDLFLDAGAQLIRGGADVTLAIVGGYPFARGFHDLIKRFPFPDRLEYVEHLARDDVRRRMQTASVLVQPSEEENFGSSIAEALACGTPVVLGPTNGTGDYIGKGGVRFSEYSAASVAEAVRQILALPTDSQSRLRAAAREAAVGHFTVDRVVDQLEEILRTAEQPGSHGRP